MKRFVIFLLFLLPSVVLAQYPHPILRSFSAIKQPNGVFLKWVIKGGKQCDGTRVFRSANDYLFEQIEHVEGICGSFTEDETYTYFDSDPASNTYNHYRLQMGFQGFTDTVTVFFEDFGVSEHLVVSDHALQKHRVLFSNDNNAVAEVRIYNHSGALIMTQEVSDSDFSIDTSGWRAGIYVFTISGVSAAGISGKFYVAQP